jgi:hypothetical protein
MTGLLFSKPFPRISKSFATCEVQGSTWNGWRLTISQASLQLQLSLDHAFTKPLKGEWNTRPVIANACTTIDSKYILHFLLYHFSENQRRLVFL